MKEVNENEAAKKATKEEVAKKAIEEQDTIWKAVHGIDRDEHHRLLLAGFEDEWIDNTEWQRWMEMNERIRNAEIANESDEEE